MSGGTATATPAPMSLRTRVVTYYLPAALFLVLVGLGSMFLALDLPSGGARHVSAGTVEPPAHWLLHVDGTVTAVSGAPVLSRHPVHPGPAAPVGIVATPDHDGYWVTDTWGDVAPVGNARSYGSVQDLVLSDRIFSPIVATVPTPDGSGYWQVDGDGAVYAFGAARYYGSIPALPLAEQVSSPVVALLPVPTGTGYWLVDAAGNVYAFGTARWHGSVDSLGSHQTVVAAATTPSGAGYWLATNDGTVYAFGDAGRFAALAAGTGSRTPVVAIAPTPGGRGYWLVTAAGGLVGRGDAHGQAPTTSTTSPVVAVAGL